MTDPLLSDDAPSRRRRTVGVVLHGCGNDQRLSPVLATWTRPAACGQPEPTQSNESKIGQDLEMDSNGDFA
jgi:hypothetical protein